MKSIITSSYFFAALFTCAIATGCSSRPNPVDVALSVESNKPGTEYQLTGTVDLDGKKVQVDQKTPYRFAGHGLETNAKIVSKDTDCNLSAKYESGADRDLTSQAIGPVGCEVTVSTKLKDRTSSTQILVKALPGQAPVAPAAAVPAVSEATAPAPAAPAAPEAPVAPTVAP